VPEQKAKLVICFENGRDTTWAKTSSAKCDGELLAEPGDTVWVQLRKSYPGQEAGSRDNETMVEEGSNSSSKCCQLLNLFPPNKFNLE
jgi:hypothetical protein